MDRTERLRAGLLRGHAITELPDPTPLIDGILDFNTVSILYGSSGAGKSFVALDWALHVATGRNWWGHRTVQAPVLYVVAEGAHGTKWRYRAWCEYHEVDEVEAITWLTVPANLLDNRDRDALYAIVDEVQPSYTVLDTLARHMPGGDENSFTSMSLIVEALDTIKRMTGGCAQGVHHTGKDEAQGSRGHSSLKGGADAELSVKTARVDGVMQVSVFAEKLKDREDHLSLCSLVLGKVGPSLVPMLQDGLPLRSSDRQALAALNGAKTGFSKWWKATGLPKTTFARSLHNLIEHGFVSGDSDSGYSRL